MPIRRWRRCWMSCAVVCTAELTALGHSYSRIAGEKAASPPDGSHPSKCWVTRFWGAPMDGIVLALFLFATFLGGFTSGLSGFAAGLVVSGIWLHIITPLQTAVLIAAYRIVNHA